MVLSCRTVCAHTRSHTEAACTHTCSQSSLRGGDTCPSAVCQGALRLAGRPAVARPAVRCGAVRCSAVGTDACPSARADTAAPTPLVQEDEMCHGVLAELPEMSTWRDRAVPAPWPWQAWWSGALPRIRREARNMPR